jgi:putative ABC transport system permease protein
MSATKGLWGRAPFLLFRFPGALAAIAVAALVLGAGAGARRLYQASIDTAIVQETVRAAGTGATGFSVQLDDAPATSDRASYRDPLFADLVEGIPHLGDPVVSVVWHDPVEVGLPETPNKDGTVVLGTRTGFEPNLQVVDTNGSDGWWISRSTADLTGAGPGDELLLRAGGGRRVTISVAGVYEDLAASPPTDFWRPLYAFIYQGAGALAELPPPMMLADRDTFFETSDLFAGDSTMRWEAPLDPTLTLPEAREVAARIRGASAAFEDPREPFLGAFDSRGAALSEVVDDAAEAADGLRPATDAVALAGILVGLALFVVAGVFAAQQRRSEYTNLSSRGIGSFAVGARTGLEGMLPAFVGAAAGWFPAKSAVEAAGPSTLIPDAAVATSIRDVVLLVLGALILLAAVTAGVARAIAVRELGSTGAGRPGRLRRAVRAAPWEAAALAVAILALIRIVGDHPEPATGAPPKVDLLVPLFPVLFVLGVGGLALRLLRRVLPHLARVGRHAPASLYLALRRLASAPRSAMALVLVGALAVGIVAYAGIAVASAERTAERKSLVFVGSQSALGMNGRVPLDGPDLPPYTVVARLPAATTDRGTTVTVLGVDPATFAGAAAWDPSFSDASLDQIVDRFGSTTADGRVPVVLAGRTGPVDALDVFGRDAPVDVVATASTFPGMSSRLPMVVVPIGPLEEVIGSELERFGPRFEIWVDGPAQPVVDALNAGGFAPLDVRTAAEVRDQPDFRALEWVFGFMLALGALVATVALAAMLLYLQARQRTRDVSYALASRMGLRRRTHRWSVAVELFGLLAMAFVVGAGAAAVAATLVRRELEVLPNLPPEGVVVTPVAAALAIAAALAVLAWIAAWVVQRRTDRANVAEVMRFAG